MEALDHYRDASCSTSAEAFLTPSQRGAAIIKRLQNHLAQPYSQRPYRVGAALFGLVEQMWGMRQWQK